MKNTIINNAELAEIEDLDESKLDDTKKISTSIKSKLMENEIMTEKRPGAESIVIFASNTTANSISSITGTKNRKENLVKMLKDNLTCEMYHTTLGIFEPSNNILVKLNLIIFLLAGLSLVSYTTLELFISYFEYGIITTSRTIYEMPVIFPKITICNLNPFTTYFGMRMLYKANKNFSPNLNFFDDTKKVQNMTLIQKLTFLNNLNIASMAYVSVFNETYQKKLGHSLDDIMLECKFNYDRCSTSDFTWSFDSSYGNCYSFNANKSDLKLSFMPGQAFGLRLTLYSGFYENLTSYNSALGSSGIIVRLDNNSFVLDHSIDGIQVASGRETFIAMAREFKSTLPKPYSNCDFYSYQDYPSDSNFLLRQIDNSSYVYTQSFCFEQCLQNFFLTTCNCTLGIFVSVLDSVKCVTISDVNCAISGFKNVFSKNNYAIDTCLPLCPLECNTSRFKYRITTDTLIGDIYVDAISQTQDLSKDFVARQINSATVAQNIVKLNIFYESLSYEYSDESPQWDIFSLIASLGGNLGLFLGAGFLSLSEIITSLIEIYFFDHNNKINIL
jgi:hypothetical protein